MIAIIEWLVETLGLGALKIWLASRKSTAEQLGQQEENAKSSENKAESLNRMIQADAAQPTSMEKLMEEQKEGKL